MKNETKSEFRSTLMNLLLVDSLYIVHDEKIVFEKDEDDDEPAGIMVYYCDKCDSLHLVINFLDGKNRESSVIVNLNETARHELFTLLGNPPSLAEIQDDDFVEKRKKKMKSVNH